MSDENLEKKAKGFTEVIVSEKRPNVFIDFLDDDNGYLINCATKEKIDERPVSGFWICQGKDVPSLKERFPEQDGKFDDSYLLLYRVE